MKYLGRIIALSYRAQFVLQGSITPPLAAIVYTRTLERLGEVIRVFGPVKTPYITVAPFNPADLKMKYLGAELYVEG